MSILAELLFSKKSSPSKFALYSVDSCRLRRSSVRREGVRKKCTLRLIWAV